VGLEDDLPLQANGYHAAPRATLLVAAGTFSGIETGIWMGGAHSHTGDEMLPEALSASWVIDAAGDMPPDLRRATGVWLPCVFADLDSVPLHIDRIHATVQRAADAMRAPGQVPEAVYSVCQHGMNRSGLLAGLLLRELGMSGDEVVALIRSKRPGSLSNQAFERIIRRAKPG
jgi:hypothetical protein